jgi:hypothetical protein
MSETDTQQDAQLNHDQVIEATEEPTVEAVDAEVEAQDAPDETGTVVVLHDADDDEDEAPIRALAIRHVIERQLVASQSLSEQLVEAATDVSAVVVHAPAAVIGEIRAGANLPTAFSTTGTAVREAVNTAGSRVRAAVGEYVDARATLPKAVVAGAADVAESVVRAQGTVAATAVTGAFTVATVAARGGDVREAFGDERREVRAQAVAARGEIAESVRQAREQIGTALDVG